MTGFRVAFGGAQQRFGIRPDLTTLGKIIGGGLPVAAYGGRADIMSKIAPLGPVYQAGTLSGNPLAVAAGLAMLRSPEGASGDLRHGWKPRRAAHGVDAPAGITVNRVGSMFTFFFTREPVTDWESAKRCDTARFGEFFHFMLERGVYLAPSQFEAASSRRRTARRTSAARWRRPASSSRLPDQTRRLFEALPDSVK